MPKKNSAPISYRQENCDRKRVYTTRTRSSNRPGVEIAQANNKFFERMEVMDLKLIVSRLGRTMLGFSGGLLVLGLPQPLWAQSGSISGKVVFVGDAPQAKKIRVTKDNEKCGSEILNEELIVSADRGIKNAVVSVAGVKGKAAGSATIDQKGCFFAPHVVIVPTGGSLDILNNDGILHNFHTQSSKNAVINKAQPGFKKKMTEKFTQPEVFKVVCDAHSWMAAWIVVTNDNSAVSADGGAFKITDVPAGTHKVEVWHETLGKLTKEVTVKVGEEAKITIELSKK
ncbi:MAG: carboxypeptidase regulatory-like domain-containing protein [Deltaproteobacteria bacterium]|nr:carboxypeptidase regulatory-like domain-containing protein [Deltaproteobacteria bacterium]